LNGVNKKIIGERKYTYLNGAREGSGLVTTWSGSPPTQWVEGWRGASALPAAPRG